MGKIRTTYSASDYFEKELSPKKSSSLFRELTFKSKSFHSWLRKLRIRDKNKNSHHLSKEGFLNKLSEHQMYTYIIKDNEIIYAETGPGWHDRLSKHLTLAEKEKIHYGGEMYVVDDQLYMTNASGTYLPDEADLVKLKTFMKDNFEIDVEVPRHGGKLEARILKKMRQIKIGEELTIEPFDEVKRTFSIYKALNKEGKIIGIVKPEETGIVNFVSMLDIVSMRRTIEEGGKLKRDISSYKLSEAFGFDLVAKTEMINDKIHGTKMDFLDNYVTGRKADKSWFKKVSVKKAQAMYLFDIVLGHQDRHADNLMVNSEGDLKLIDNDLVLHNVEKLRWHNFTNAEELFPHAIGKIDNSIKEKVMELSEKRITHILKEAGLEEDAIKFALNRYRYIRQAVEEDKTLVEIMNDFDHMARISCQAMRRECMAKIKKSLKLSAGFALPAAGLMYFNQEQ